MDMYGQIVDPQIPNDYWKQCYEILAATAWAQES